MGGTSYFGTSYFAEYEWNHANLLTQVSFKDNLGSTTKSVNYTYDALGRRIGKSVDDDGNGSADRSQAFIYDGAGLLTSSDGSIRIGGPNSALGQHGWVDDLVLVLEDSDGTGPENATLSSRLLHGPAIDQVFAQEAANGDILWALADHQGTVKDWVESADFDLDGSGESEVVNHVEIDAFGTVKNVSDNAGNGTTLDVRLTVLPSYTGQILDSDAGLHHYRAR